MNAAGSRLLEDAGARQGAIFALLGAFMVFNAMASVNERALFLPVGTGAAAFGAIAAAPAPPKVGPLISGDSRRRPISHRLLGLISNPPTALRPPVNAPAAGIAAPAFPDAEPAPQLAQSDTFTPAALNAPQNFAPGSAFNPAAPGGSSQDPGGQAPPNPIAPVAALPEPAGWIMMMVGVLVVGATLRRARMRHEAIPSHL